MKIGELVAVVRLLDPADSSVDLAAGGGGNNAVDPDPQPGDITGLRMDLYRKGEGKKNNDEQDARV